MALSQAVKKWPILVAQKDIRWMSFPFQPFPMLCQKALYTWCYNESASAPFVDLGNPGH